MFYFIYEVYILIKVTNIIIYLEKSSISSGDIHIKEF